MPHLRLFVLVALICLAACIPSAEPPYLHNAPGGTIWVTGFVGDSHVLTVQMEGGETMGVGPALDALYQADWIKVERFNDGSGLPEWNESLSYNSVARLVSLQAERGEAQVIAACIDSDGVALRVGTRGDDAEKTCVRGEVIEQLPRQRAQPPKDTP